MSPMLSTSLLIKPSHILSFEYRKGKRKIRFLNCVLWEVKTTLLRVFVCPWWPDRHRVPEVFETCQLSSFNWEDVCALGERKNKNKTASWSRLGFLKTGRLVLLWLLLVPRWPCKCFSTVSFECSKNSLGRLHRKTNTHICTHTHWQRHLVFL